MLIWNGPRDHAQFLFTNVADVTFTFDVIMITFIVLSFPKSLSDLGFDPFVQISVIFSRIYIGEL